MSETTKTNRWYNIRLKKGKKERFPYHLARKSDDDERIVLVFNGASHKEKAEDLKERYDVISIVPENLQERCEKQWHWEFWR